MTITWFGHSCFRLEAKGSSILIDPFTKDIGLRPPKIKDDIVLVSHDHYDHNNLEGLNPEAFLINTPGEYEKQGIYIKGIMSYHDNSEGKERGLNTIYVVKGEELVLCHMGDFGQEKLTDAQVEAIGDVDVLMLPIGGKYTINYKEAVSLISQIEPKIVIPMHYKLKDLKLDIDGPDKFLKEAGIVPEKVDKLKIAKKTLPIDEVKMVMFNM